MQSNEEAVSCLIEHCIIMTPHNQLQIMKIQQILSNTNYTEHNLIVEISSCYSICFVPAHHIHKSSGNYRDVQILSEHSQWAAGGHSGLTTSQLAFHCSALPLGHRALQLYGNMEIA